MRVLGIETSCDDTAVAIVDGERRILAHRVRGQEREHRPFAGVVPEIAARAHVEWADRLVRETLALAAIDMRALDGVAATVGPGLIGGLLVGSMTGKALALAHGLPFLAVNHLEGHALTARLTDDVAFPYLLLLVSGGHCQILLVEGVGRYRRWGTTLDDAAGEAFDKVARMLGLGFPGGPAVERAAAQGDPGRFDLPRPFCGRAGCDFSFAGLKTAVRRAIERLPEGPVTEHDTADIAAAFQAAVADVVADRVGNALDRLAIDVPAARTLVVAGGVAANLELRTRLATLAASRGVALVAPPVALCTDNGAMIAWAGVERLRLGLVDGLDAAARPRWPLDPTAPAATGAGVKA